MVDEEGECCALSKCLRDDVRSLVAEEEVVQEYCQAKLESQILTAS